MLIFPQVLLGTHEFLPSSVLIDLLASKVRPIPGIKEVCGDVMFLITEKDLNFMR